MRRWPGCRNARMRRCFIMRSAVAFNLILSSDMKGRPRFAIYLHPETTATTKPPETIAFVGSSWPDVVQIRQALVEHTASHPSIPLRIAALDIFGSIHTATYLQQLQLM